MQLSQLKEEIRTIIRERSINAIQKEYGKVVSEMEHHLELYKKSKGTPEEKKHISALKTLTVQKKKLQSEIDTKVASLYKDAELKVEENINEVGINDWHFKAIEQLYKKAGAFGRKKIAALITKNPNASWNEIASELKDSDYSDVSDYTDALHLESINEIQYKDAVEKFNADLMKNSQVERISKFHKRPIKDVVKALQPYLKVLRYNDKSIKLISIDFRDTNSDVKVHVSQTYKQNESVKEDSHDCGCNENHDCGCGGLHKH